mgnify:CR=1 FL=1
MFFSKISNCIRSVRARAILIHFENPLIQFFSKLNLKLYIKTCKSRLCIRGVLPKKLVRGVPTASQNPYPKYDLNLEFPTLFMTWPLNQYPSSDLPYN